MKMKNRNGSTLVLTLMVFAVLMILATFILGFMVTENKQAMYHQNKTQAYYIAKSGADIAEAAIVGHLNSLEKDARKGFIENFIPPGKNITLDQNLEGINYVEVETEGEEANKDRVLTITASATFGKAEQKVKKVIYSNTATIKNNSNTIEWKGAPLVAIIKAWRKDKVYTELDVNNKDKNKGKVYAEYVGLNSIFKPHVFPDDLTWVGEPLNITLKDTVINEDKFYNGNVIMEGNIGVIGKVNIYISGNLKIENLSALNNNADSKPEDLNIFVYNKKNEELGATINPDQSGVIKANIYLENGKMEVDLKKATFEGNLVSNDKFNGDENNLADLKYNVIIKADDSSNKINIKGSIYAPDGKVVIGGTHSGGDKSAILQDGIIVGKFIMVEGNNHNKNFDFLDFILSKSMDGVSIPVNTGSTTTIDVIKYYSYYTNPN